MKSRNSYSDKQKFWSRIVQRWEELGEIKPSVFCREFNLDAKQFSYWRTKFASKAKSSEIELFQLAVSRSEPQETAPVVEAAKASLLRVTFEGFTIEIDDDFNPQTLSILVKALRGSAC